MHEGQQTVDTPDQMPVPRDTIVLAYLQQAVLIQAFESGITHAINLLCLSTFTRLYYCRLIICESPICYVGLMGPHNPPRQRSAPGGLGTTVNYPEPREILA